MTYRHFVNSVANAFSIEPLVPKELSRCFEMQPVGTDLSLTFWEHENEDYYCEISYGKNIFDGKFHARNYKFSISTEIDDNGKETVYSWNPYPEHDNFDPEMVVKENLDGVYFYIGDSIKDAVTRGTTAAR